MHFHADWLAKRGNTAEEYEDAFAADPKTGRFAVADGATESAYAAPWARLLVEHFVANPGCDVAQWATSLPAAQSRWSEGMAGRTLPWYAEMKVQQGAFATFLGVEVTTEPGGQFAWQAIAVGDSCLFRTRGSKLLNAFPIKDSRDFGTSPQLIGSRTPSQELLGRARWTKGKAAADDRFWLMTDALAQWFLSEYEAGGRPWEQIEEVLAMPPQGGHPFGSWIDELRDAKRLRNDDVTMLTVGL